MRGEVWKETFKKEINLDVFLWSLTWHFIVSTCQNMTSSLPIPRQGNVWANASLYMGCEAANTRGFMELVVLTKIL